MSSNDLRIKAYHSKKKSKLIAYILWVLFCFFGIHRLYLRRYFSAIIIASLTISSIIIEIQSGEKIGNIIFIIPLIWSIFDLFIIPKMVQTLNIDIALDLGLKKLDAL